MTKPADVAVNEQQARGLDPELKPILAKIANTIRGLSMDAVQKADSGHPGLPMGCAELGAYLFACALKYNPKDPKWFNRDRFILSAGHGSMLLYSCLHLAGYDLTMEDHQKFPPAPLAHAPAIRNRATPLVSRPPRAL